MRITIKGNPIAKKRPRFARRGNFVKTYNDQQTEEGRWLWEAMPQITKKFTGAVKLTVSFCFNRPKSHYGTGKNSKRLKVNAPVSHTKKPDLDNLVKFVKDCLNGQAWDDDAQVCKLFATKEYGDAKTIIYIQEA